MNKKLFSILLLVTLVASSIAAFTGTTVQGADAPTQKTYAVVDAIPNAIGLGETTLLKCGILQALESAEYGWKVSIIVTDPDGTNTTLGPFKTDSTGSTFTEYVPTKLGTYTITTIFPEQPMPVNTFDLERGFAFIPAGTIMQASTASCTLVVTEESPTLTYPGHSLPTEYWSRPIDPQLREWWSISGNWVSRPDNSLVEYNNDAPETAHALWAKDLTTGGLTGGLWGDGQVQAASESGDAYEGKFPNSIIMNGILYYQRSDSGLTSATFAVDLHTGEQLWTKEGIVFDFGQILYWNSYNVDGVYTYLWAVSSAPVNASDPRSPSIATWTAYDPYNGNYIMAFTNMPTGSANAPSPTASCIQATGKSGEILLYVVDYSKQWMALWNSTLCGLQTAARGSPDMGSYASNCQGKVLDGSSPLCYSWNVSIANNPPLAAGTSFFAPILKVYDDRVVSVWFNQTKVRVWGIDTSNLDATSTKATILFDQWWTAPDEWLSGSNTLHYVGASNNVEGGVIAIWDKELRTHYGFSVETGKYLWATDSENYLDAYGWGNAEHTWYFAYGKLYSVGVAGILYAYDLTTGDTVWTYNMTDVYGEPVTGQNWWGWIDLIADGKIYIGTLEHSAENPLPRGAPYIAVNASNGAEIWRINGMYRETRWGGNGIIGDSIIATMDTYDQRVYAIGKGPTQLTVDVPGAGLASGQSVMIRGTVSDISPGLSDYSIASRFPNGVPAVSDASQSQWMLYVWKQFEKPTNATGVPVAISVVDANGNYRTIGTTTSDANGDYAFAWTPDISGEFHVLVSFAGSAAYYGSSADSAFVVDQPVATATPQPTAAPTAADLYFIPGIIGVIVTIIVVGAVLLVALRKRP